jgi:hypothetical protein
VDVPTPRRKQDARPRVLGQRPRPPLGASWNGPLWLSAASRCARRGKRFADSSGVRAAQKQLGRKSHFASLWNAQFGEIFAGTRPRVPPKLALRALTARGVRTRDPRWTGTFHRRFSRFRTEPPRLALLKKRLVFRHSYLPGRWPDACSSGARAHDLGRLTKHGCRKPR